MHFICTTDVSVYRVIIICKKLVKEPQETDWNLLPEKLGCKWRDFALHSGKQGRKS